MCNAIVRNFIYSRGYGKAAPDAATPQSELHLPSVRRMAVRSGARGNYAGE